MGSLLFLAFILLIGPLAVRFGADSRIVEDRPTAWWPGGRS